MRVAATQCRAERMGERVTVDELPLPPELKLADVPNEFVEVKPDVSLELRLPASQASIELLVEIIDAGQRRDADSSSPTTRSWPDGASPIRVSRGNPTVPWWCSSARTSKPP